MLHKSFIALDKLGLIGRAKAHCDIPCGIYDPAPALIAAHSIVRLMDILHQAHTEREDGLGKSNLLARSVIRKEEEAEKVKQEVRVIWGDYFEGKLLEEYPEVHGLVHEIMLKASSCKQDVHREDALALVELVNQFAELFWMTKGIESKRVSAPYAPGLPMIQPVLS